MTFTELNATTSGTVFAGTDSAAVRVLKVNASGHLTLATLDGGDIANIGTAVGNLRIDELQPAENTVNMGTSDDVSTHKDILRLKTPTLSHGAANKSYVDATVSPEKWVTTTIDISSVEFSCNDDAEILLTPVLGSHTFALPAGTSRITGLYITFAVSAVTENLNTSDSNTYGIWWPVLKDSTGTVLTDTSAGVRGKIPPASLWGNSTDYSVWAADARLNDCFIFYFNEVAQSFTYHNEGWSVSGLSSTITGDVNMASLDLQGATVSLSSASESGDDFYVSGTYTIRYSCI